MPEYLSQDFLLGGRMAARLFYGHAEAQPIIDYHNHLPARHIAQDRVYSDLCQLWLEGDHYKWRAMRAMGFPEDLVSGAAAPKERFLAFAATLPRLLGNPLSQWSQLELWRYLGIREALNPGSAQAIWDLATERITQARLGVRSLLAQSRVEVLCTTDDPADDLSWHEQCARDPSLGCKVLPGFRPDRALAFEGGAQWRAYLETLGAAAHTRIGGLDGLLAALENRHLYFHQRGCRISDHGLGDFCFAAITRAQARSLFARALKGRGLSPADAEALRCHLLLELAAMDQARGWAMQLHAGAQRNLDVAALARLGPDTGFDACLPGLDTRKLAAFLNELSGRGKLPKTIVYTLNPNANESILSVLGAFQGGGISSRMQFGPAWWFNDHLCGIRKNLEDLAAHGVLGNWVGMLTDSRSFMSFARHEYFRRVLCSYLGGLSDGGLASADEAELGAIVRDICAGNARAYFGF